MKLLIALLIFIAAAQADGITGHWRAEIDTQIGHLKYVYKLQADGNILTGKADLETTEGKREIELIDGEIFGDTFAFAEIFKFQDREIRIDYKGRLCGDEIRPEGACRVHGRS